MTTITTQQEVTLSAEDMETFTSSLNAKLTVRFGTLTLTAGLDVQADLLVALLTNPSLRSNPDVVAAVHAFAADLVDDADWAQVAS